MYVKVTFFPTSTRKRLIAFLGSLAFLTSFIRAPTLRVPLTATNASLFTPENMQFYPLSHVAEHQMRAEGDLRAAANVPQQTDESSLAYYTTELGRAMSASHLIPIYHGLLWVI